MNRSITVQAEVRGGARTVWELWNGPEHIERWMHASDDWECTRAVNDLRPGGNFSCTLGAKDGSVSFDLTGTYSEVEPERRLAYVLDDGRSVSVSFEPVGDAVRITQTFEMEHENSEELQRNGWQATLDSFKRYAESQA